MILKSLKVERFGCLNPGAFIARFDPHVTVIHGPNESGKTTLFTALSYALYQRHGLAAQDAIARMVPHGRDVAPRVEVAFEVHGTTWRLTKQFVKRPDTELHRLENGTFVPHAQGPGAEDRLRELLGSGRNPKGIAGPEYRGIGEVLLVDQGRLRFSGVSELARDRLRVVVGQVGTTEGAHGLLAAVERRYTEVFGKGGDVRERSAIGRLSEDLDRLRATKAGLDAERARAERLEVELADLDRQTPAQAAEEIARLDREIEDARKLDLRAVVRRSEKAALEASLAAAVREAERLARDLENLRAARDAQKRRLKARVEVEARLGALETDALAARRLRSEAEGGVVLAMTEERELTVRERALDEGRRALELAERIPDLDERCAAWKQRSEAIRDVEQAIAARRRPSAADLARFRAQVQTLREKERDADRLEVRVRITAEADATIEVGSDPVRLRPGDTREIAGDALEVRVPGVVRVEVQAPGGIERATVLRELEAARAAVRQIGLELGTEDLAALEDLGAERARLEGELAQLGAARDGLFKTEAKAKEALADLAAARATLGELVGGHPEWGGSAPDAATLAPVGQAVALERRHLASAKQDREALRESRAREAERVEKAVADESARLGELKLETASGEATIAHLEAGAPDDSTREAGVAEAIGRATAMRSALEACQVELDTLGDPQVRIERLTSDKRAVEEAGRRAAEDRVRLTERLDQIRERGIWMDLGDVDGEIETVEEQLVRERVAADALKLLRDVLVREQAAAVEAAVRPVAERVGRMARYLFGASAKPSLGENLGPRSLALTEGADLPVELLSAGTQDQLALLVRLALGEIYAERCGRHAFVLDDPLVNCDRDRRGRLLELLAASRSLQIVIFTCSPELYRGLPGERAAFVPLEEAKLATA